MYITLYKKINTKNNTPLNYDELLSETPLYESETIYQTTLKIPDPPKSKKPWYYTTLCSYIDICLSTLAPFANNYEQSYYEFKIPKKSGGLRTINAPNPDFKIALKKVLAIFKYKIKCLEHPNAYAYIQGRSITDALIEHQKNDSQWFLKLDLKDFFPSCTPEFILAQLSQLYPFYYLDEEYTNKLYKILKICSLHGGLPQGSPISPYLTNLAMVPFDYTLKHYLTRGTGQHYVYTRYADDMLISCKASFNYSAIENTVATIIQPFIINHKKTRYGSRAGRNWNLGLMLNKDNKITLGHIKNKQLNAMLNNFLKDYKNNIKWSKEDTQVLQGNLSYLQQIEPEYYNYIINKYSVKYALQQSVQIIMNEIIHPSL